MLDPQRLIADAIDHAPIVIEIAAQTWGANLLLRTASLKALQWAGLSSPTIEGAWPRLIPWRQPQKLRRMIAEKLEEIFDLGKKRTGGFMSVLSVLTELHRPGDLVLGRAKIWGGFPFTQYISTRTTRSINVYGMTGAGKSNLLQAWVAEAPPDASSVIVDVKGTMTRTVLPVKARAGINTQIVNVLEGKTASYNPLTMIAQIRRITGQDFSTIIIDGIAQALVPEAPQAKDPFWRNQAVEIVKAFILHEYSMNPHVSLTHIYDRLMRGLWEYAGDGASARGLYLESMLQNRTYGGFIARVAGQLIDMDPRTLSGAMAGATGPMAWLGHERTKSFVDRSDFCLTELKGDKPLIVDLACPAGELRTTFKGYFRMMLYLTTKVMELVPNNTTRKVPTRIIFDEMQNIGKIEGVPTIWPLLRGYQALGIACIQDPEGLRHVYGNEADTIMANAEVSMYLATESPKMLDHISKYVLGDKTRIRKNGKTGHIDERVNPVMAPDQLRRYLKYKPGKGGNVIAVRTGERARRLRLVEYFRDYPVWKFDPDPEHPIPFGHKCGRALVSWLGGQRTRLRSARSQDASKTAALAMIRRARLEHQSQHERNA